MKPKYASIKFCLGIDISKADFHVALLRIDDRECVAQSTFTNSTAGYKKLLKWLVRKTGETLPVHVCLEATGSYGDGVAFFLSSVVSRLSVVNPRAIKAHGEADLRRCKSDPADARLIADYCLQRRPEAWNEPTPGQRNIKAVARRIATLKSTLTSEQNRLKVTSDKDAAGDIRQHIKWINNHIEKLDDKLLKAIRAEEPTATALRLLTSIKGIGERSAAYLIAEVPDISIYSNARQLAAYAGVTPRIRDSGTSGSTRTPMCKAGNTQIRRILFFPALTAMTHNPVCKAFAQRLRDKGKPPFVVMGAVMAQLLRIIYGVLKHQKPFDPNHLKKASITP